MKTATTTPDTKSRKNGEQEMTLKEYFAQNPDVIVFKEKVERGRENLHRAGLTDDVLRQLLVMSQNGQLPEPKYLSPEELKTQNEDYVFELFNNWENAERTIIQLKKEIEKKDRLIASLRQQLESRMPAAA